MRIRVDVVVETEAAIAVEPNAPATPVERCPTRRCNSCCRAATARPTRWRTAPREHRRRASRPATRRSRRSARGSTRNLEYRYGVSDAATDALDTLAHGAGVCRDFAHVGIALCRALQIPARMVVGYLYQLDPMDMHAWFEAFVGGRWYTFDATQDAPRGGRIVVAYGRDAADVAFLSNYGALTTERLRCRWNCTPTPCRAPLAG